MYARMPTHLPGGNYFSTTEAARVIGLTPGRLRQLILTGELRSYKIGRATHLVPAEEVHRLRRNPAKIGRPRKAE